MRLAGDAARQGPLKGRDARWFTGECVWESQQLEAELQFGMHVLVQVPLQHLQPLRCGGLA